jgi:hypothetical protein
MPGTSPGMTSFGTPPYHWLLFESGSEERAQARVSKDGCESVCCRHPSRRGQVAAPLRKATDFAQ